MQGSQPVDFWAFNRADFYEFLSCEHTKPSIEKLYPGLGDSGYTNRRRPIVTVVEDNSPGQHDMQFAACDPTRYSELGFEGEHASCQENLHSALRSVGIEWGFIPQPWNLFTNFFINPDATFSVKAPQDETGGQHHPVGGDDDAHRGVRLSAGPESYVRGQPHRYPGRSSKGRMRVFGVNGLDSVQRQRRSLALGDFFGGLLPCIEPPFAHKSRHDAALDRGDLAGAIAPNDNRVRKTVEDMYGCLSTIGE